MFDEEANIVIWNFAPYTAVREDVIAEVVFVKKWQKLMLPEKIRGEQEMIGDAAIKVDRWFAENEQDAFPILDVLTGGVPDEHDTRIATNMIRWLGTNDGRAFMYNAEEYKNAGIEPEIAYLAAWSKHNIRRRWINHGSVARDWLTQSFDDARQGPPRHPLREIEALEQVARWLGRENGQAFIAACNRNIDIKHGRASNIRRARIGLPPLAPP